MKIFKHKTFVLGFVLAFSMIGIWGCESTNENISGINNPTSTTEENPGNSPDVIPINCGIILTDFEYDPVLDQSTFTYSVTSNPGGGPAISHWVIEIEEGCGSPDILLYSNDPPTVWTENDPTTGVRGIKFDNGYIDGETREVIFTLAGEWFVEALNYAVKSGNGFILKPGEGPVCDTPPPPPSENYEITGVVFFDANQNGVQDTDEPGIGGVEVTLNDETMVVTDENGEYWFLELDPGDYVVTVEGVEGLFPTTSVEVSLTIENSSASVDFGFALDFEYYCGLTADGKTIGFWKNNIKKAIDGKTKGVQVSAATLEMYLDEIYDFGLYPFSLNSLQEAYDILSATGSDPMVLLKKQLLASEFNYMNEAYIDDNEMLTYFFLYYGEFMIVNESEYSSAEILNAKDWYDAYNNSHGGEFHGPGCVH